MDGPLLVIEDDHGRLREVNDRPMIMIFASKPRRSRTSHATKHTSRAAGCKSFAFINIVKPGEEDEGSRQLIRTHVARQKLNNRSTPTPPFSKGQLLSKSNVMFEERSTLLTPPQLPTDGPAFVDFPVQMQPYMHKLIHQYSFSIIQMMDPKHPANPTDSAWFPMVMTDPALFHAVLCTSAIYVGLLSGKEEPFPQSKHMIESISLINARLRCIDDTRGVSDATITTILFLAKAEYAQCNYTNWAVHMDGLKRIVKMRGGMIALPSLIRQKIYDSELLGCIETGALPRFPFIGDSAMFGPSITPRPLSIGFESLAYNHLLDRSLHALLNKIEASSYTCALDTRTSAAVDLISTIDDDRYRLLAWTEKNIFEEQFSAIQQCIRYGAVLYISTLLPKPLVRCLDYTAMQGCLRRHLLTLELGCLATTELLVWLLCIGGITAEETGRAWFVSKLKDIAEQAHLKTWDDVKLILAKFWWIGPIHVGPGLQLWDTAKALQAKASHKSR